MSVSDKTVFIFGLGILIIGRGLYSPNITSLLGIVSRKDNITTESTMLTQMVAASFAGFCAPFLFGILNRDSLFFISLFAGFTTLVPAVLFFFTKNVRLTNLDTQNSKLNDNTNMPLTDLRILILTLGAGLCFNLMKNYGSSDFLAQFSDVSYHKNIFRNTALVDGFAYLIIATLFAIVWNFFKLSPYIKLFLGFVLYSFALYSFNLVKNLTPDSMVFVTVQLLVVLEVICQLLIFPTLTALLLDNAPLKLLSTSVAVYLFLFQVLNITTMQFKHSLNLIGITQQPLLMAGFSVLLALLSILNYIHKKKAQSRPLT